MITFILLSLWPKILLLSLTHLQRDSAVTTQWSKMDHFLSVLAHPKSVTDTKAVINMGTTGTNVEHSMNSADFIDYFLCSFLI